MCQFFYKTICLLLILIVYLRKINKQDKLIKIN